MIINTRTGQIAYHCLILKDNGPAQFKQYDYNGKPMDRILTADERWIAPKAINQEPNDK
jgi:hypothetical protein